MDLSTETLLEMQRRMLRIRYFDELVEGQAETF